METPPSAALRERLGRLGPPLGTLAAGRVAPALAPDLAAALAVDRPTRDRLVIFDPASAPLIRPLAAAADLRPWTVGAAGRWLIAVPRDTAPQLGVRHQALARHLDALTPPAGAAGLWWALAPGAAAPPSPRIIVGAGGSPCAWDESAAIVGGPATVIAPAEPYWLALLGSRPGARLAAELGLEALPVPDAPGPARANLEGLALGAAALAAQIDGLERAVLRRLLADFGPPGVAPGPALSRWWELSFAELHAAVLAELRNDIPERFRPTWEEIHADQQDTHREAAERLAALQSAIDTQVAALYDLRA